jgi:hypothetical protein
LKKLNNVPQNLPQTVLSRLSRWAEVGAIERDYKRGRPGRVTFRIKKSKLTKELVEKIREEWEVWARAKQKDFFRQGEVLKASGHIPRCKLIHKAFLCDDEPIKPSKYSRRKPSDCVPGWLM